VTKAPPRRHLGAAGERQIRDPALTVSDATPVSAARAPAGSVQLRAHLLGELGAPHVGELERSAKRVVGIGSASRAPQLLSPSRRLEQRARPPLEAARIARDAFRAGDAGNDGAYRWQQRPTGDVEGCPGGDRG
jgi:hypothetical protein